MNECTVVGFRAVSFKDQKTGQMIEGTTLYLYGPDPDGKVTGYIAEKVFISPAVEYTPKLQDKIILRYNKYGKVRAIETI